MSGNGETAPLLADDARSDQEADDSDDQGKEPSRLDRVGQWLRANIIGILIVALLFAGLVALIIYFASMSFNRYSPCYLRLKSKQWRKARRMPHKKKASV